MDFRQELHVTGHGPDQELLEELVGVADRACSMMTPEIVASVGFRLGS